VLAISISGRKIAGWALVDVGTTVATFQGISVGLSISPYRLPRCSWPRRVWSRPSTAPTSSAETRFERAVQDRYAGLRLDLTDAVNVILAEAYETTAVLTLDRRDFRTVRPLTDHENFLLLPDDL
jgi:hypothetical protein